MTWTYRTGTDIGKVRLGIGDDTEDSGVRPDGTNFSDEEIQVILDAEGSWQRAVAGLCEVLAVQWARLVNLAVGPRREDLSRVSEAYAEQAARLRAQYGGGARGFAVGVTRVDGWSDDEPSDSLDDASGEYGSGFEYVRPEV